MVTDLLPKTLRLRTVVVEPTIDLEVLSYAMEVGCFAAGRRRDAVSGGRVAHRSTVGGAIYTPTYSFGMIGLRSSAAARLNVVNLVRTPPPIFAAIAQVPCKVELDVYDDQGKLLKSKTIPNLGYGQADFLDVLRSDVPTAGTHVDISAVVKVASNQSYFAASVRRLRSLTASRAIPRQSSRVRTHRP